ADVSSAWLDRVRTATIRLSNCTASFVSPDGLILTNHHCAQACLDEHSSSERNLLRGGFLARSREQELKCGTQIADVLMSVENVTERVAAAIRGLDDRAANDTRKKTLTRLEQAWELVFVSGHPGTTDRLLTVAQLETLRDVELPRWLLRASELRGRFIQFAKTGAEADRIVEDPLNGLENSIKVRRKQLDALLDERLLQAKRDEEAALRARVAADPQLAAASGDPWTDIAKAQLRERELYLPYTFLEAGAGLNSRLFNYARTLLRGAAERPKPNTERLREYRDAALARIAQRLTAPVPVYP